MLRRIIALLYLLNFLVGAFITWYVLTTYWDFLPDWEKAVLLYQLFMALCGVLIVHWLLEDEQKIKGLGRVIERLRQRISTLEEKS